MRNMERAHVETHMQGSHDKGEIKNNNKDYPGFIQIMHYHNF